MTFGQAMTFGQELTPANQVTCPSGIGTVTCTSPAGLDPGQSVTLVFHLHANETVRSDAVITGSVTGANGTVHVAVSVAVKVTQAERDAVQIVSVHQQFPWLFHSRLVVTVRNTGTSTAPVDIRVSTKPTDGCAEDCRDGAATTPALQPGEQQTVLLPAYCYGGDYKVTVTASLGSATVSKTVLIGWWWEPIEPVLGNPLATPGPPPS